MSAEVVQVRLEGTAGAVVAAHAAILEAFGKGSPVALRNRGGGLVQGYFAAVLMVDEPESSGGAVIDVEVVEDAGARPPRGRVAGARRAVEGGGRR